MDLRQTIRETLDGWQGAVHTATVAAHVAERIDPADRDTALSTALTHMVRDVIINTRPSTPKGTERTLVAASATSAKSWKRDAIRKKVAESASLDAWYATGDGYKPLRNFTHDELTALATRCQSLAEQNAAQAARFFRMAERMKETGAATVGDLDLSDLSGEAA